MGDQEEVNLEIIRKRFGEFPRYPMPQIGQDVYIPTSLYLYHGVDDFSGGLCRIIGIKEDMSGGRKIPFVEVDERRSHWYNWEILMEQQEELRKRHGNRRGYPDPDYRSEFNDMGADWKKI